MRKFALIVTGGSGTRMNAEIPKQFIELKGIPILMHTIRKFHEADNDIEIHIVLPQNQMEMWNALCKQHNFSIKHQIHPGGNTRFQSVTNGLKALPEIGLVAIHDGVRPLITHEIILENYEVAATHHSAITTVTMKDSIRKIEEQGSTSVPRDEYLAVQTPQTFSLEHIKKAYHQEEKSIFTDDASVYESLFGNVSLVDGDYRNIKITTPEDMIVAEAFLSLEEV